MSDAERNRATNKGADGGSHVLPGRGARTASGRRCPIRTPPCGHPGAGGHRPSGHVGSGDPGPRSRVPRRLAASAWGSLRWPTPRRSSLIRFFFRLICSSSAGDNAGPRPPTHRPSLSPPWRGHHPLRSRSICTHAGVVCTRRRAYGLLPSEGCYLLLLVLIEMVHHAIPIPVMLTHDAYSIMPSSGQGSDDGQRAVAVQTRLIRATGLLSAMSGRI